MVTERRAPELTCVDWRAADDVPVRNFAAPYDTVVDVLARLATVLPRLTAWEMTFEGGCGISPSMAPEVVKFRLVEPINSPSPVIAAVGENVSDELPESG